MLIDVPQIAVGLVASGQALIANLGQARKEADKIYAA